MKYYVLDFYEYDPVHISNAFANDDEQFDYARTLLKELNSTKFKQLIGLVIDDNGELGATQDYLADILY